MKWPLALLAGFVLLAPVNASAQQAESCGSQNAWDASSAEAGSWCSDNQPGRLNERPVSMRARWNSYCAPYTRSYQDPTVITEEVVDPDGSVRTTTSIVQDEVTLSRIVNHPNDGVDGVFRQGQFDFMISMGWDPTSVVGHYQVTCTGVELNWASATDEEAGAVHFTVVDPVPVEVLRDNALAKIDFDPPGVSSAPPTSRSVVKLPTWLWVDTPWVELSDDDSQGAVVVEVFARPQDVTWAFDDGEVREFAGAGAVVCVGPGEPWTPADGDADSACQYTFTYPSSWNDDEVFHGTATVRWAVAWSLNGEDQGWFVDIEQATPFDVKVVEIQTVGVATSNP